MEGFYFGKAVQKIIQQNVAVKRENVAVLKKKLNQPTSSGDGREWKEESQPDRQDSWPLVGKAISLSTLQRTTAWAQGWVAAAGTCHSPLQTPL